MAQIIAFRNPRLSRGEAAIYGVMEKSLGLPNTYIFRCVNQKLQIAAHRTRCQIAPDDNRAAKTVTAAWRLAARMSRHRHEKAAS